MRKVVTEEMVASAVEHCLKEGLNPSRGRVMAFMSRPENGGCAGDPQRVGTMIREYLAAQGGPDIVAAPVGECPSQPLPPQIEEVMAQAARRLSDTLCSLSDAISSELNDIRVELRKNYDQAADQIRRDADQAVVAAQADEQDALNALNDALSQKAEIEEQLQALMSEHSGAAAVAAERGEQLERLGAELGRTRTEALAEVSRLIAERDEATRDVRALGKSLGEKESAIASLESRVSAMQSEVDMFRQQAGICQALADDRAERMAHLEAVMATALNGTRERAGNPAEANGADTAAVTPSAAIVDQTGAEQQQPSGKNNSKSVQVSKPSSKDCGGASGNGQDGSEVTE